MEQNQKKAILVVSFGTSFAETRKKTIDAIEADLAAAYPDYTIYRAWTSKMILKKLKNRDGIVLPTVSEAVEQMIADGVTRLIVQPTHVINGIENDQMKADVLARQEAFTSIAFGTPLLTTTEDQMAVIRTLMTELPAPSKEEALVLMGHGTVHYANAVYAALDYTFKDLDYPRCILGTVEAYPSLESVKRQLKTLAPKKVILAPFMVVAGDHATNDLAGEEEDSWKSQLEAEGYEVSCILKGLGEYPGIRKLYIEHAKEAMKEL